MALASRMVAMMCGQRGLSTQSQIKYTIPEREESDARLRRLIWHSTKRGMVENELILGSFARLHLTSMPAAELDAYDRLLQEADPDVFNWITGKEQPNSELVAASPEVLHIIKRLQQHVQLKK